jgi:hypothetical protein
MQDDPVVGLLVVIGVLAGLAALLVLAALLEPDKPQAPAPGPPELP